MFTGIDANVVERKDITMRIKKISTFYSHKNNNSGDKEFEFYDILDSIPVPIFIKDSTGIFTNCNKAYEKFMGLNSNEIIGKSVYDIAPKYLADKYHAKDQEILTQGNMQVYEGTVTTKGMDHYVLFNKSVYRSSVGEIQGLVGVINDITEQKKAEQTLEKRNTEIKTALANLKQTQMQLVQQEKLAGIGQLAAGVAHEINNPLGFVLSNFDSLKKYLVKITDVFHKYSELKNRVLESDTQVLKELAQQLVVFEKQKKIAYIFEDLEPIIQESDDGLKRLGDIVKALKLFSRVDKNSEFECYDLNVGIKNTLIIGRNEIKYVAEMELELGEIPEIQASAGQINQVLLNIIINAAHGIKEKQMGKLGMIRITSRHDDQFVYCSIQDNGIGMTAETIKNIFTAFFTTKPSGQGTGLGLSISYDIVVNKHRGDISVSSEKGIGTTFTIKLPIASSCKHKDI